MKRYAIVDQSTGLVENVCQWDGVSAWAPPAGRILVQHETIGPGDAWCAPVEPPFNPEVPPPA